MSVNPGLYEPGVDYAVLPKEQWAPLQKAAVDPSKARFEGDVWRVAPEIDGFPETAYIPDEVMVLGRWDDRVHPLVGHAYANMTWAELANKRLDQRIERMRIEGRLAAAGIRIDVPRGAREGQFYLNNQELDRLLSLAGF